LQKCSCSADLSPDEIGNTLHFLRLISMNFSSLRLRTRILNKLLRKFDNPIAAIEVIMPE
jgi:hypothetical protein